MTITGQRFLSLLIVAALHGCASGLSKDECQLADWSAIGFEDGVQGRSEAHVAEHRKACAEHGVAVSLNAYRQGWNEGVRRYCLPGSGYRQGRSGTAYAGVCPSDLEADFLDAYDQGRQVYRLETEVRHISRTLSAKQGRLRDIETEMRDTGLELVASSTSTERRVVLLDELRKLERERGQIDSEIPTLERELAARKRQLASASATTTY